MFLESRDQDEILGLARLQLLANLKKVEIEEKDKD